MFACFFLLRVVEVYVSSARSRVVCCAVCGRRAVFVAVCVCCVCDVFLLFVVEVCGLGLCLLLFAIVCVIAALRATCSCNLCGVVSEVCD